jgi:hypothetical protein
MTRTPTLLAALAIVAAGTAQAESFASSAVSAGSQSIGSLSTSIRGSSDSSSPDEKTAEGDYRIIEVATLAERPGMLRLRLQALDQAAGFLLDLPQATFDQQRLAVGDVLGVRHREYGLAVERAATREAFFLVLADTWMGELESRKVGI